MRGRDLSILILALVACSGTSSPSGFGDQNGNGGSAGAGGTHNSGGSAGAGGTSGGGGSSLGGSGNGGSGGTMNGACPMQTQFVYVITVDNVLYRFDPPSLNFTSVGTLNCPAPFGSTPYSMGVDRTGQAWVVFNDGHLYKVDTSNAACSATSFAVGQSGFVTFGMGFSTDTPGGSVDTLYVSDSGNGNPSATKGLAKIDIPSLKLTPIAGYDAIKARAEMTGTGDARLFGAFEGSPYIVAQVDKTTAHIVSQAPQNAINYPPNMSNFAFAFWGGDFWLFVGPGQYTDVFQYKPSMQTTTKVKTVQFEIVGAGVSTCAPTMPPK